MDVDALLCERVISAGRNVTGAPITQQGRAGRSLADIGEAFNFIIPVNIDLLGVRR